ncbi:MAG: hypothetical protein HFI38_00590 [Lachnospiraceae bacterium]|jgi:hypothetical protein|nr:hypothetical protein [Lachnospiraceae bacterium]
MARLSHSDKQGQKERVPVVPSLRTYQLTEKKYLDTRSSSSAMLGAGIFLFYICLIQLTELTRKKELLPEGFFAVLSMLLCLILFYASRRLHQSSIRLKLLAERERQLANELVEWFITTYSGDQIDSQIEALSSLSGVPEILCLQRLDMIRILLDREYDRDFEEEFISQLCEDLYNMLFEKEAADSVNLRL